MKNIILIATTLFFFAACQNQQTPKQESAATEKPATMKAAEVKTDTTQTQVFACPMHPEVTGKKGDNCSKCGMALEHQN